jgi:dGTPase
MEPNKFLSVSTIEGSPKWEKSIHREKELYKKDNDIRTEFERDYTRILHCTAYRRLKHKTQVFFATRNDHVCTRIEHVNHVTSVSHTISKFLGLNTQLTASIAMGHDLGRAPFGHWGEKFLSAIFEKEVGEKFWHEKNSLRFVDKIETLPDTKGKEWNLNLTYAVRDGIICHCGEVDETSIFPRDAYLDLNSIDEPNKYAPFTWEGCIVKIADKISYLGRDIEDAILLGVLTYGQIRELRKIVKVDLKEINNTILIHNLIIDLCQNSTPAKGICLSDEYLDLINQIKKFNYANIYFHERITNYRYYAELIINTAFQFYRNFFKGKDTLNEIKKKEKLYPFSTRVFTEWLIKYSDIEERHQRFTNELLYHIEDEKSYSRAIIEFIAGMTDNFAEKIFDEVISF